MFTYDERHLDDGPSGLHAGVARDHLPLRDRSRRWRVASGVTDTRGKRTSFQYQIYIQGTRHAIQTTRDTRHETRNFTSVRVHSGDTAPHHLQHRRHNNNYTTLHTNTNKTPKHTPHNTHSITTQNINNIINKHPTTQPILQTLTTTPITPKPRTESPTPRAPLAALVSSAQHAARVRRHLVSLTEPRASSPHRAPTRAFTVTRNRNVPSATPAYRAARTRTPTRESPPNSESHRIEYPLSTTPTLPSATPFRHAHRAPHSFFRYTLATYCANTRLSRRPKTTTSSEPDVEP